MKIALKRQEFNRLFCVITTLLDENGKDWSGIFQGALIKNQVNMRSDYLAYRRILQLKLEPIRGEKDKLDLKYCKPLKAKTDEIMLEEIDVVDIVGATYFSIFKTYNKDLQDEYTQAVLNLAKTPGNKSILDEIKEDMMDSVKFDAYKIDVKWLPDTFTNEVVQELEIILK